MDFFAVPTIAFGLLYAFFVIGHDRRRILHIGITRHPTNGWVAQQLREAFPYDHRQQYLIFDHDAKFGYEVDARNKGCGTHLRPNVDSQSMAKRYRRALGWQLPPRPA